MRVSLSQCSVGDDVDEEHPQTHDVAPVLQQFKFVAAWLSQTDSSSDRSSDSGLRQQLNKYINTVKTSRNTSPTDSFHFWRQHTEGSKLATFAQELLSAPASQAYVERIFSVCGLLTSGRRNRMNKSLEMRVLQKLNSRMLTETGFVY